MSANLAFAAALIFSPLAAGSPPSATDAVVIPVVILNPTPVACASGYHQDQRGNCQPNIPQTNPFCPSGLVYQPMPWGWNCEPPPKGY